MQKTMNVRATKAIMAALTVLLLAAALTDTSATAQIVPNFPVWCNQNGMYYRANLATDTNNCGACGAICPAGTPCKDGKCVDSACPAKRKIIRVNQNPADKRAYHSIKDAVAAAQPCDTILVAAGTYKENIEIDKSLSIKGAGEDKTIVDGSNKHGSVFVIGSTNPDIKVTLSDIKIQNGQNSPDKGGGILNSGTLLVSRCTITGNAARYGGGVYNVVPGVSKLTVSHSTISGNTAETGAGIYNLGDMTVTGSSKITDNTASNDGGGIHNYRGSATISGSTISRNTAQTSGGIANWGNLIVDSGTIVSSNRASTTGGGIANYDRPNGNIAGNLIIKDSSISGNIVSGTYGRGGGIYNEGQATIEGCTIGTLYPRSGGANIAAYGGGIANWLSTATLTFTNSHISWNRATIKGGGVYNYCGTYTYDLKQVHNNYPNDYASENCPSG